MASKNDLIYDRTSQDIIEAYNSVNDIETKKGCFNAIDMNRLCDLTNKVVKKLNDNYSAGLPTDTLSSSYTSSSAIYSGNIYTVFNRIQLAITKYNNNHLEPTATMFYIDDYKKFDYIKLNAIEQALYNMCVGLSVD